MVKFTKKLALLKLKSIGKQTLKSAKDFKNKGKIPRSPKKRKFKTKKFHIVTPKGRILTVKERSRVRKTIKKTAKKVSINKLGLKLDIKSAILNA